MFRFRYRWSQQFKDSRLGKIYNLGADKTMRCFPQFRASKGKPSVSQSYLTSIWLSQLWGSIIIVISSYSKQSLYMHSKACSIRLIFYSAICFESIQQTSKSKWKMSSFWGTAYKRDIKSNVLSRCCEKSLNCSTSAEKFRYQQIYGLHRWLSLRN